MVSATDKCFEKPQPSSAQVSARMARQRSRDTGPAIDLRRHLYSGGWRYRLHETVVPGTRRSIDIVFRRSRVAVFVDGCFWHGCPIHSSIPRSNERWWQEKLDKNIQRDRDTDMRLREAGWSVVRVWEHQDSSEAAVEIAAVVHHR